LKKKNEQLSEMVKRLRFKLDDLEV